MFNKREYQFIEETLTKILKICNSLQDRMDDIESKIEEMQSTEPIEIETKSNKSEIQELKEALQSNNTFIQGVVHKLLDGRTTVPLNPEPKQEPKKSVADYVREKNNSKKSVINLPG